MFSFVNLTRSQFEDLGRLAGVERITMLNLLRFRDHADYSATPSLDPGAPISGRDAFERYMAEALPIAAEFDGILTIRGSALAPVVGPEDEDWDEIYVMRFPDGDAFLRFVGDSRYRVAAGHRTAALADSRLVPLVESEATREPPG